MKSDEAQAFRGLAKRLQTEDVWSEVCAFPRAMWRAEVAESSTNLGYWEWVDHRIEAAEEPAARAALEFEVELCRTGYAFKTIRVTAVSQTEAEAIALDDAGNHLYAEKHSKYSVSDLRQLEQKNV